MADAFTQYWGLTKPEVGSSRDSWGGKLNTDLDTIDLILQALMPIGVLADFAGANAPLGWLLADGTVYQISLYPKLFAAIGSRYGGDGTATFAVPDTRARVLAGVGATTDAGGANGSFALGQKAGWFGMLISASYLPASLPLTIDAVADHVHGASTDQQGNHVHGVNDPSHAHSGGFQPKYTPNAPVVGYNGDAGIGSNVNTGGSGTGISLQAAGLHGHNVTVNAAGGHTHTGRIAGGGQSMPLYQPLLAATKIIFAGPPGHVTLDAGLPPALLASPSRGSY